MCQWGANRNPWAGYRMGLSRPPRSTSVPLQTGGRKVPFQFSAKQLEVVENVNRTHFRIYRLVVEWCNEQSYRSRLSRKWRNADLTQYAWLSPFIKLKHDQTPMWLCSTTGTSKINTPQDNIGNPMWVISEAGLFGWHHTKQSNTDNYPILKCK